jgi:hypothetical protein
MVKLTRTLGENIPPELVFGLKCTYSTGRPTTLKGMSAPIYADEPVVLSPVPQSNGGSEAKEFEVGAATEAGATLCSGMTTLDSPRQQATFGELEAERGRRENEVRRKEREWSGESNMQDMGDVVVALRELR